MDPQALDFKKVHFASRTQSSYASFTYEDATPALTSNLGELIHAVSMSNEQRYPEHSGSKVGRGFLKSEIHAT